MIRPKRATLIEMLKAAAQSELGLVFVNRKEQDQDVPFARIREQALSVAAERLLPEASVAAEFVAREVERPRRLQLASMPALRLPTSGNRRQR